MDKIWITEDLNCSKCERLTKHHFLTNNDVWTKLCTICCERHSFGSIFETIKQKEELTFKFKNLKDFMQSCVLDLDFNLQELHARYKLFKQAHQRFKNYYNSLKRDDKKRRNKCQTEKPK